MTEIPPPPLYVCLDTHQRHVQAKLRQALMTMVGVLATVSVLGAVSTNHSHCMAVDVFCTWPSVTQIKRSCMPSGPLESEKLYHLYKFTLKPFLITF